MVEMFELRDILISCEEENPLSKHIFFVQKIRVQIIFFTQFLVPHNHNFTQ